MARILVAEDEDSVREFVTRALVALGHEAHGVGDGEAAVQALAAARYDLLLTDIVMPGMDGIALALQCAADHPDMKVLMMSGYAEERRRAHNLDAIIHRVIAKPFSLDELGAAVRETLAA